MLSWFRRRRPRLGRVTFCDSCGHVCTAECRSAAQVEQTRLQVLKQVGRFA